MSSALAAVGMVLSGTVAAAQSDAEQGKPFNIRPQSLQNALTIFGQQAEIQVSVDAAAVRGVSSPGVTGSMPPQAAIGRLLAGSGLSYRFTNPSTVLIGRASVQGGEMAPDGSTALDTIVVQGQGESAWGPVNGIVATQSASGSKTDTPLRETPASISVISRKQVEEMGAQGIDQAVRGTPSVVSQAGGLENATDYMYVRGFTPTFLLNGLYLPPGESFTEGGGTNSPKIEPYGLERIEVLRGSASALYGQLSAGGALSLVSKRPTETPFGEVQLQTGSYARKQAAFDFGGPVTEDGTFLYRLTGLGRITDTQIDYVGDERAFIAPSFTWKPTADTTFTFLSSYQKSKSDSQGFLPAEGTLLSNPNGRISTSTFLGDPGYNDFDRESGTIGYEFEHRFNEVVSFKQNLQYGFSDLHSEGLTARTWTDSTQRTANRRASMFDVDNKTFAVDNQVKLNVDTGSINHTVLAGLDYQNSRVEKLLQFGTNTPDPIDVFNPVYNGYTPLGYRIGDAYDQRLEQFGIYVQDQMRYERWLLTLSGRHDWASTDYLNKEDGLRTGRNDDAFSGRAGLNYLFDGGWSPYVSYATSFQPTIGTTFTGDAFEPTRATQIEAGLKYQPEGSPIFLGLSVFDITKTNMATTDPVNLDYQVQTGEGRIKGIELEAKATLFDNVDLIASYTYSKSEITKSNESTIYNGVEYDWQGNQLPFVPKHQASLWVNYRFEEDTALDGLSLGAGVRYMGDLYGESGNVFKTAASTQLDLSASYDFGKKNPDLEGLNLRVNVTNVTNDTRVNCVNAFVFGCYYGEGRSALATLTYRW